MPRPHPLEGLVSIECFLGSAKSAVLNQWEGVGQAHRCTQQSDDAMPSEWFYACAAALTEGFMCSFGKWFAILKLLYFASSLKQVRCIVQKDVDG